MPAWPHFDDDERAAADAVLGSGRVNYWTGEQGHHFERDFAAWVGVPHAVAVSNGTVALEIALRAIGVGPGDEVVVPSATFIATAAAVATCGAIPVVVDVDRGTRCLTAGTVEPALTARTVAIVVVHLGGFPADMAPILHLARERGLTVVEDCAQAHGARRGGRMVGTHGTVAAWSFCQDKIMSTAGEGGAITTADPDVWRRCWEYKDHGKNHDAVTDQTHPPGFRWLHDSFGTNARMTEVQAAVGRRQLGKVDGWVALRRAHAARLTDGLRDLDALRLPATPPAVEPAFYRYHVELRSERLAPGWDRDRVVAALVAEGVPATQGGCSEIQRERAFRTVRTPPRVLPNAAALSRTTLTLPVHHRMSDSDVDDVVAAVRKVLQEAAG
ncbi:DegT/DnrJ/EryC1/StrS family aminotransferase [Pseudonocardia humida]|uniref:DegT/DnrJ/EryC1/StrS family aminotransferase n=1 Tax=Pseudonocardia humida TaxID=2800819 RepID=A0ABT0ZT29_9PSEU|nr:DegT/DnrJ/EryC1/StrS family aminotransferase [Pseudonocardia humida]MCO1653874.1 DegT/DnrJ/EryC1/StrS family aminotransferase [Pseudonocardia humida]